MIVAMAQNSESNTDRQPAKDPVPIGLDYFVDTWQRSVLFWDVMRQRGDNFIKHEHDGKPPLLRFAYELVMDGRDLPRPANYALLRVTPPDDAPKDPTQRPIVVVDPRAGHGPGIGGFKADSQVGVAMRHGHPVYFVTFFPEPVPGQTLRDVAAAEASFIEEVTRRHPQADGKPCIIGNCQAGWAVATLAALRPDLMSVVILNGAPLSYWSGVDGKSPMRYMGGLIGGKWLASLASDLGNGRFDGALLVENFERLNPANTWWIKPYTLYSKIDTEADRFLEFERWWGGFFLMNAEEMDQIVSELFLGNKLTSGDLVTRFGERVDLRSIKASIVVFASFGDNITPPPQALNWIADVYGHEDAIVDAGQVIVYVLHRDIGHLGIFVSGKVALKEHTEMIGDLDMIDRLPPGLYEMVIESKKPGMPFADLESGDYHVRFELRTIEELLALDIDGRDEERSFETVNKVSELADGFYQTWIRPWVRGCANEWSAEMLRSMHPLRMQRYLCSSWNPLFAWNEAIAGHVKANRRPASQDNPFVQGERNLSRTIVDALDKYRVARDMWIEAAFRTIYGAGGFGDVFPPGAVRPAPRWQRAVLPQWLRLSDEFFETGGELAAILRLLVATSHERRYIDRRSLLIAKQLRAAGKFKNVDRREMKTLVKEQSQLLRLAQIRSIEGLAKMLPTREMRLDAVRHVFNVLRAGSEKLDFDNPLVVRVGEVLDLDLEQLEREFARDSVDTVVPDSPLFEKTGGARGG